MAPVLGLNSKGLITGNSLEGVCMFWGAAGQHCSLLVTPSKVTFSVPSVGPNPCSTTPYFLKLMAMLHSLSALPPVICIQESGSCSSLTSSSGENVDLLSLLQALLLGGAARGCVVLCVTWCGFRPLGA